MASLEVIGEGTYNKLNESGYLVIPTLCPDQAKSIAKVVTSRALQLIFVKPGYPVNSSDQNLYDYS